MAFPTSQSYEITNLNHQKILNVRRVSSKKPLNQPVNPFLKSGYRGLTYAPGKYPLFGRFLLLGLFIGTVLSIVFLDYLFLPGVLVLFMTVGGTWRAGAPPMLPFCFAFMWWFVFSGYTFYSAFGYFPGGGWTDGLQQMVFVSLLGLFFLFLGVRIGMGLFQLQFSRHIFARRTEYSIERLQFLTVILFSISYAIDLTPTNLGSGFTQILNNLLALRFVPYFVLLVVVFQTGTGFRKALIPTIVVVLPQLLTGFSDFKEIMFVILLAWLIRWQPWKKSKVQSALNRRILITAPIAGLVIILSGMLWTSEVKPAWRGVIWQESNTSLNPVEQLGLFSQVLEESVADFSIEKGLEDLTARTSSSALYFSYVLERVPSVIPHENGRLVGLAFQNLVPRFLFPGKPMLGGDSWLVRRYAGVSVAGDEQGASIGLAFMAEFYIDYGFAGVASLCFVYGFLIAIALAAFARAAPTKEVFFALSISFLLQYFTGFGSSFIKIFAGAVQQVIIFSAVSLIVFPQFASWAKKRGV